MVPVPAPNETAAGILSVPGAVGGLPGPAPIFSVPIEPAPKATTTNGLLTVPPSAIVSVPVPLRPRTNTLPVQVEPAPVPVTVPCEPAETPTVAWPPLITVPPLWIVSMPVPTWPTLLPMMFWVGVAVQVDPTPVTVTVPCEPAKRPTAVLPLLRVPPLWIVSMPVPAWPTLSAEAVAPAVPTTVAFGTTVSINADVAPVGTPGAVQLPGENQLDEIAPVQPTLRARADLAARHAAATTVAAK